MDENELMKQWMNGWIQIRYKTETTAIVTYIADQLHNQNEDKSYHN